MCIRLKTKIAQANLGVAPNLFFSKSYYKSDFTLKTSPILSNKGLQLRLLSSLFLNAFICPVARFRIKLDLESKRFVTKLKMSWAEKAISQNGRNYV